MTNKNAHETCGYCFKNTLQNNVCSACGKVEPNRDGRALNKVYLNDKYFIGSVLGEPGGYGIAYLAYDEVLQRKVVIKEMFPSNQVYRSANNEVKMNQQSFISDYEQHKVLFLNEARKLAQLSDINSVVNISDFFSANNTAYFVMSFVEGMLLSEYITKNGPLNQQKLINWFYQICVGLSAVHAQDIFHRDIKPENIIIDKNDNPILIDFGNAISEKADTDKTFTHALTPCYAAPEQHAKKDSDMGAWTDIYSLGATMYYCVTAQRPESAENLFIRGESLTFKPSETQHLSRELVQIIESCIKLRTRERPQTMRSLLLQLEPLRTNNSHWTTALPNNKFGKKMRAIHKKRLSGAKLPVKFNWVAGFAQSFWFFSKNLNFMGVVSAAIYLVIFILMALINVSVSGFIITALVVWAVMFLPIALFANHVLYNSISTKILDINYKTKNMQQLIYDVSKPTSFGLQMAIVFILLVVVLFLYNYIEYKNMQQEFNIIKLEIDYALETPELREDFLKFYEDKGIYPKDVDELVLEYPNKEYSAMLELPNYQFNKVEFKGNKIELYLSIEPFKNDKAIWTLTDSGQWQCHSSTISSDYLPSYCLKTDY